MHAESIANPMGSVKRGRELWRPELSGLFMGRPAIAIGAVGQALPQQWHGYRDSREGTDRAVRPQQWFDK
jgi:hypothetical protein